MVAMRATAAEPDSTRQRLLDAAISVFTEVGYDGARVQEIARRAGLTTGAIYGRFRGKADLLGEAIGARTAAELDELLAPRGEVADPPAPPSATELLVALGDELMSGPTTTREALLVEAMVAARRDDELARIVRESVEARVAALGRVVDSVREQGGLARAVDTDTLVRFGMALALGTLLFRAIDVERPDGGRWSALIGRLVGSLAEDPAPDETPERPDRQDDRQRGDRP